MKMFSYNAGELLFEKAKSISAKHEHWRCLYINFSSDRHRYSDGLRTHVVTNIIKELLESEEGYIYLCTDKDVFILFQGQARPILDKIGEQFHELGAEYTEVQAQGSLYTVFDLSVQWEPFFKLCEQKSLLDNAPEPMPQAQIAPTKPLLPPDAAQFAKSSATRATRQRLTVLLVEDDPFTRRLVANALKADYEIVEAGDAADALQAYGRTAPDAVFLDIELPDASGHVVLSKLLAFDPNVFAVMLSANSIKENILAALEKGAKGFVTKPFAKEKLMHYLRQCETVRLKGAI